jgi:hypothetical protein
MQQFESDRYRIVLKNSKIRSYRFIALLLVFLNLAVFILLLASDVHFFESAAALFLVAVYCLYRFYVHKKYKSGFFMDEVSFFILAGSWIGLQNYLLAFACIVMGILYHLALQKLLFIFNKDFIKKMNFPQAEYSWNMFSNVLLRDNILTLDFNNNKLIQAEIVQGPPYGENVQRTPDGDKSINEVEFNTFARQQLLKYTTSENSISLN